MIKVTSNIKDVRNFIKRFRVNIKKSQTKLATRLTAFAKTRVEVNAPTWHNVLRGKVAMRIFPKSHRGEVFMSSPLYNMIAMQQEFNLRGRRKLYKTTYPKIAEWAEEKGIFVDKPYVIVGGSGTRMGGVNRFFEPGFIETVRAVPEIGSQVINEVLMKTRG